MARTRLIVELGMGVDMHGRNYTKSAKRAIEDAIRRGSLLYLADAFKAGQRPKVYIDVIIASPKPEEVDAEAVLGEIPFGEKTIRVVPGGMDVTQTEPDNIIITNASVLVSVES
jgi:uncharacterized protein (TIGR02058 family)